MRDKNRALLAKLQVPSATLVESHRVARRIGRTNVRFYYLLLHRPRHGAPYSYRETAYFFFPQPVRQCRPLENDGYRGQLSIPRARKAHETRAVLYYISHDGDDM